MTLYGFNRFGSGLQTTPSVFTAQSGDTLRPALAKGSAEKGLADILLHNKILKECLAFIREVLQLLADPFLIFADMISLKT